MNEDSGRKPRRDCQPHHESLSRLLRKYNPGQEALHIFTPEPADPALFSHLLEFARTSLALVRRHQAFFSSDEGSFYACGLWNTLFLGISAAVRGRGFKGPGDDVPRKVADELIDILVEISAYSTVAGGDIRLRNHEALEGTIRSFWDEELAERALRRARATGSDEVLLFTHEAVRAARRARETGS